jgi:hypothetical protein
MRAFSLDMNSPEQRVLCPKCGDEYVQLSEPTIIEGKDAYATKTGVRGDVIKIEGKCAGGHRFDLCLGYHKGETFIFAQTYVDAADLAPKSFTAEELTSPPPRPKHGDVIEGWKYDEKVKTLTHVVEGYEVDLNRCQNSPEALDWIAQVAGKSWATPAVIGGLVLALDEVLNLQGSLCGSGVEHGKKR